MELLDTTKGSRVSSIRFGLPLLCVCVCVYVRVHIGRGRKNRVRKGRGVHARKNINKCTVAGNCVMC